jgi:hypothetical protein
MGLSDLSPKTYTFEIMKENIFLSLIVLLLYNATAKAAESYPACYNETTNYYIRMRLAAHNQYTGFLNSRLTPLEDWEREKKLAIQTMSNKLNALNTKTRSNQIKILAAQEYIAQIRALTLTQNSFIVFYPMSLRPSSTNTALVMFKRLHRAMSNCSYFNTNPSADDIEMIETYSFVKKYIQTEELARQLIP